MTEYISLVDRFKYVTLWGMKTRVPLGQQGMGYPTNNELFHLLTAFVEELFQKAPRVCAYMTEIAMGAYFIMWLRGVIV